MRFNRFVAAAIACLAVSGALLVPLGVRGATWSENVMVNEASLVQHTSPSLAAGPDGVLHVAWTDYRSGTSDPDIYYSRSGTNGTSFLWPNIEVSSDTANNFTQGAPAIGVASDGTAIIAWSEFQGQDTNIRAARLGASAESFEPVGIVNKVVDGPQWTPSISVSGNRAAVVWKDEGSRNEVRLWNSTTGAPIFNLKGHSASVTSVDFSPDGTMLASSSEDGLVKLWNAATGAFVGNLSGHADVVTCVVWSPDGAKLATSSWDYTIKVWSASTRAELDSFVTGRNPSNWVAWSPNGTMLAAAYNGVGEYSSTAPGEPNSFFNVTLWNVGTGAPLALGQHGNSVTSVAFSADGKHVASSSGASSSSSFDNSVRIWNATTGAQVRSITVAGGYANSISWSDAGNLAVAVENGTTALYLDPVAGEALMGTLSSHLGPVKAVDWLPGSDRVATGGADARARMWNASAASHEAATDRVANTMHGVSISPDGKVVATGSGNSMIYKRTESHIYCAVSEDGGLTWPTQVRVDSSGSFYTGAATSPDVDIAPNGDIGVAWHEARWGGKPNIYYANSTDGGATFADDVQISSGVGEKMVPAVELDATGVAHMAWHDSRDKTWTNRFDIYYGSSDAPGANVRVNASDVNVQQQSADISVSDDGTTVTVAWVQESAEIKVASSADGGASFGVPDVVSDTTSGSRYMPALVVTGGDAHVAWEDYRRGGSNIYFSTTVLSDSWAPHVLGAAPAPGATGVSAYERLSVTFSEPVNKDSFASSFQLAAGVDSWAGTEMVLAWSGYGDRVTIEPEGWHLEYSTTYTATIAAAVIDMAGNVMASPYSWSFSTGLDVDGPMVELYDAPEETGYDVEAVVEATVVDYTGISDVSLHYKLNGSAASFLSVPMLENSAQNYEAAIPAQWVLGTIIYYIEASDTVGNQGSLPANLSEGLYLEIEVVDNILPQVAHVPITTVAFDAPAQIDATVTDGIGLARVQVEYNTVQSDVVHAANMTHVSGDNYTATLPAQGDIGAFSYRIVATDTSNNTLITTNNGVESADDVAPILGVPVLVQRNGTIIVTVTASDNHEVTSVTMHFIPVGGKRYIEKTMSPTATAGTYTTEILEQAQDGTFVYYVNASDPSGNVASTLGLNEGEPYSEWVSGKLPPTSVLLGVSIAIIVGGIAATIYMLRRRGRGKAKVVGGQPEHPLESVNTPAEGPVGKVPKKPAQPGSGAKQSAGGAPAKPDGSGGAPPKSG